MATTKSYADLQAQIAKLQAEAEELKKREVSEVVSRIKDAIKVYNLTPFDLFGPHYAGRAKGAGGGHQSRSRIKYRDSNGNTWVGRGPRPKWLREAMAKGKKLEDFAA